MRHTLKAVFDKQSDAQHVLEELIASGYTHAEIAEDAGEAADAGHEEGIGASLRHAVTRLFGHADKTTHSRHIVMFTTESDPEAERAAGIIGRFGPAGIEEEHVPSDQDDSGAYEPGLYEPGAAAMGSYPPGTEPGSLQYRSLGDGPYFGTQNATSRPSGHTYQDSMGPGTPWRRPDEDRAYHYGEHMGASETYRDSSWDEAEPSLQSDWERHHEAGESSAWHRIQAAVRRGWDRVKS
jgi:hypothetical protein